MHTNQTSSERKRSRSVTAESHGSRTGGYSKKKGETQKRQRVFENAEEAFSVQRKWQEWKDAGVWFSEYHKDGTSFALPFNPDNYFWAGPVILKINPPENERMYSYRKGHYRRGVRKYLNQLKRGERIPPLLLLFHEAWGWNIQDGNHRWEALVTAGAPTYQAFLGKPKRKQRIDSF